MNVNTALCLCIIIAVHAIGEKILQGLHAGELGGHLDEGEKMQS